MKPNMKQTIATLTMLTRIKQLEEVITEIMDIPVDDNGERIIPPGFLDKARTLI